jgi:hypothetical protein
LVRVTELIIRFPVRGKSHFQLQGQFAFAKAEYWLLKENVCSYRIPDYVIVGSKPDFSNTNAIGRVVVKGMPCFMLALYTVFEIDARPWFGFNGIDGGRVIDFSEVNIPIFTTTDAVCD